MIAIASSLQLLLFAAIVFSLSDQDLLSSFSSASRSYLLPVPSLLLPCPSFAILPSVIDHRLDDLGTQSHCHCNRKSQYKSHIRSHHERRRELTTLPASSPVKTPFAVGKMAEIPGTPPPIPVILPPPLLPKYPLPPLSIPLPSP